LTVRQSHLTHATITHRGYRIPEAARKKDVMTVLICFNRQDRAAIIVVLVVVLDFTIRGRRPLR
jgi:hypothetical protein